MLCVFHDSKQEQCVANTGEVNQWNYAWRLTLGHIGTFMDEKHDEEHYDQQTQCIGHNLEMTKLRTDRMVWFDEMAKGVIKIKWLVALYSIGGFLHLGTCSSSRTTYAK